MKNKLKNRIKEILTQPFDRVYKHTGKWHLTEKETNKITDQILTELQKEIKRAVEKVGIGEKGLIDRKRGGFTIDYPEYEDGYMDAVTDLEKKKKQVIKDL